MTRSYTLHCKRGSGKRFHKPTGQCRTPCQKSHGPTWRRSPKGPHHPCVKTGASGSRKRTSSASKIHKAFSGKVRKMYSAGKIAAAYRKFSAKKKSASKSALPHFAKISAGMKLPIGSKFTTDSGTYKRVSKTTNSKGFVKM